MLVILRISSDETPYSNKDDRELLLINNLVSTRMCQDDIVQINLKSSFNDVTCIFMQQLQDLKYAEEIMCFSVKG